MKEVIVENTDSVLSITINRPEKLNSINFPMFEFIHEIFEKAATDSSVRVVHISSQGDVFSAGADLEADANDIEALGEYNPVTKFVQLLTIFKKPIVASVPGMAVGIGTTMLLHCDLVYASDTATFITPFTSLALVPEAGSSFLLSRMAGHQTAAELLLTGAKISADRAKEMGFVTDVVSREALKARAEDVCQTLAKIPPTSMQRSKELMRKHYREPMKEHMEQERTQFIEQLGTDEFKSAWARAFSSRKKRS